MPNVMVVEHRWRPLLNAAVWLMEVRQGKGVPAQETAKHRAQFG